MAQKQKMFTKLFLPDVTSPSAKPPLGSLPSTKHPAVRLKKQRKVPPLLAIPHGDPSPYAVTRSLKNSPRTRPSHIPTHRKTNSVLQVLPSGNSPTTTTRVRVESPEACFPSSNIRRSTSLLGCTESPSVTNKFELQPKRGKLDYFRQMFAEVIKRNEGCADVLEEIRSGYEEVLRQTELETMRTTKPHDQEKDSLETNFCKYLIQENRQLAKKVQVLRTRLEEVERQNEEYRESLKDGGKSCRKSMSPTERRQPMGTSSSVPKLNLAKVDQKGFHEEFMGLAEQFSQSWRDAMKEGR